MAERDETLFRATAEANEIFSRMAEVVQRASERGEGLDVVQIANEAGLEIDDAVISELEIPRILPPIQFVPWHVWWPWRPLWCWWWRRRYPWYHCCPYWWHRCRWWPL
jgi:hypothetical protein